MRKKSVKVFAPATIGNVGSAFDVLGIAIHKPGDVVIASRQTEPGLNFSQKTTRAVPNDAVHNVAAHVAGLMLQEFKPNFGINMLLEKRMPICSGLGSSGASSVAAAVAVNALLPKPLAKRDLLSFAMEGERKASGAAHADNVAPALLGGACLIRSYDPLDVIVIPSSKKIIWVVVHPQMLIKTATARKILPKNIPLTTAVKQWGNVGGLVAGIMLGDVKLVGNSILDVIIEPARAHLISGFNSVKQAAIRAGALGCSISGSGPSLFAVTDSMATARKICDAMIWAFAQSAKVPAEGYISRTNQEGAKVLWIKS